MIYYFVSSTEVGLVDKRLEDIDQFQLQDQSSRSFKLFYIVLVLIDFFAYHYFFVLQNIYQCPLVLIYYTFKTLMPGYECSRKENYDFINQFKWHPFTQSRRKIQNLFMFGGDFFSRIVKNFQQIRQAASKTRSYFSQ